MRVYTTIDVSRETCLRLSLLMTSDFEAMQVAIRASGLTFAASGHCRRFRQMNDDGFYCAGEQYLACMLMWARPRETPEDGMVNHKDRLFLVD